MLGLKRPAGGVKRLGGAEFTKELHVLIFCFVLLYQITSMLKRNRKRAVCVPVNQLFDSLRSERGEGAKAADGGGGARRRGGGGVDMHHRISTVVLIWAFLRLPQHK